jgi:hypothetical protein
LENRSHEPFGLIQDYEYILTFFAMSLPSCFSMPIPAPMRLSVASWHIDPIDTTTSFYTGLETPAAVRHFDKTILHLRKESNMEIYKRTRRVHTSSKEQG